ncbi:hypothetical protein FA95DRAFT_1572786, partial [Auriscalpium vulgare]
AQPTAAAARPTPTPTTSLRSAKPSWHRAARPGGAATSETRQRVLVFVAGGMSFSEMREAYQLSHALNKDIYIGSTHTFTPRQFVDDLKVLELGGSGSRTLPNGVREPRNGARPYQQYYDERYFTRDAPAPAPTRPAAVPLKGSQSHSSRPVRRASPEPSLGGSTLSVNSVGRDKDKDKSGKKHHRFLKW